MLFLAKVGPSLGCSPSLLSSSGVFPYSFLKGTNNGWSNGITPKSLLILLVKYSQEKKIKLSPKKKLLRIVHFLISVFHIFSFSIFFMVLVFRVFFRYVPENAKHSPLLSSF